MSDRDYLRADWQGDAPRPWARGGSFWAVHPATKLLLIALVGIHLLLKLIHAIDPDAAVSVYRALMLDPEAVLGRLHVWQLLTGTLIHDPGGISHLLFNCISIFFFGRMAEEMLGWRRYLVFLGASALSASLAYLLFAVLGNRVWPMLGASGAAMGLLCYVALRMPQTTVLFFFVLPVKLWLLAAILVVMDLLGALSADSNIAHMAHLGGALYGWVYFRYGGRMEGVFGAVDRAFDAKRDRRERNRRQEEAELRAEIDRILDKVNREGMTALSEEERRFLRRAGGKLRR